MVRLFNLIAICILGVAAVASENPVDYPAVASDVSFDEVIALSSVAATTRIVYAGQNPELQYGLLWLPNRTDPQTVAPLVVFIHGGCWLNAYDINHGPAFASGLAQAQLPMTRTQIVDGAGHFDWIHPGTEAFRQLLSTLEGILQP